MLATFWYAVCLGSNNLNKQNLGIEIAPTGCEFRLKINYGRSKNKLRSQ